jgi:hypothetical protein
MKSDLSPMLDVTAHTKVLALPRCLWWHYSNSDYKVDCYTWIKCLTQRPATSNSDLKRWKFTWKTNRPSTAVKYVRMSYCQAAFKNYMVILSRFVNGRLAIGNTTNQRRSIMGGLHRQTNELTISPAFSEPIAIRNAAEFIFSDNIGFSSENGP